MKNTYKYHFKNTLTLAYPVAIGQLGHVMMGVVDSLFVGRLGAVPLAAASIANGLFFLIFVIGLGVTFAISPLVATASSANRPSECAQILRNGLIINLSVAVLLISVLFAGSGFLKYLNQPADVARLAAVYMRIVGLSILPMMIFQTFRQFTEGLSIMRPAMVVNIVANLVNALGNWVLVFGKLGFPALGFEGSAIATLLTRCFMAAVMTLYVLRSERFRKYKLSFGIRNLNSRISKKILGIGFSSGFQYFFEVGAFSFAAIMIGWIGTLELAANQIALNLATIPYMAATGISAAAAIRVGGALGRGDTHEIRRAGFSALILAALLEVVSGIIFVLFRSLLPSLYIDNLQVISIASSLLIIASFFQISDGVQAVALGALRGITDVRMPTLITFVSYWILGLPAGYIFAFNMGFGVRGVWFGFIIGLTASALMLTSRFYLGSKKSSF
ncbi:MAG: MATE family efflux transporter [Ignavibacteria bacterium]|jgi:MATE family multidrug resistance protein|nr:MATE family efflux transporter [Ignavibacteria bacterium]MCU7505172.1 MATE family efflux transporter [Ignavibacteria bacterium]MCU7518393.1 MATE family efflux transporter [Ignavibacteria bacterium]